MTNEEYFQYLTDIQSKFAEMVRNDEMDMEMYNFLSTKLQEWYDKKKDIGITEVDKGKKGRFW